MEAGESSISNASEMDGWTLIRDHSDDESAEDQKKTNKSYVSTKSTKSLKLTGAAKRKFSKKRSAICSSPPMPFNYHVTVEPEISGHDTIIRITKLCDDDPTEEPTESKYFEIDDDDGDEIIYLSDSPPPVQKPVKQKRKRSRKRKVNLETIHEQDSPPLRPPPADQGDSPESDDDIVILPKQNKRRKLEKLPKLAQEKNKDGRPREADVTVPKKTKNRKVIKLTHVPCEEKKEDKSGDQRESAESEDDVVMLPKGTEDENLEKPSIASGNKRDGPLDDELVIIPKRNKRRKLKESDNNLIVPRDNFDMSAPSWTVTVELDDDDNYKVVDKDVKPEEISTSPDVITSAANTLLKFSEDSPKVIVIQPPSPKREQGLSDSQSSTEKADEDNVSVQSVEGEENTDVVETKVIKLENGKRTKTMCVCPCGMMFSHRSGLSRHRRIVHLGMTYRCQMCGEHFTRSDSLNDHIRRLEHWNQQINNLLSPSTTPKRGMYKEFESQGERRKPGQKKSIINYEIVNKVMPDGTQNVSLVKKSTPLKNDSDSICDDVQPEKGSDSGDAPLGENTERTETGLVASEESDNGETESPEQAVVSPKDGDSDKEASSPIDGTDHSGPGGDSIGDEQAHHQTKSDNLELTPTSKGTARYMKELSPPPVEASPDVVSIAAKLVQTGTRKLTLSSSVEDKSEKIKPRTLIKEILCSPQIVVRQSTPTKTEVAGQKSLKTIVQKSTENDGAEVHKDTVVVDVSAPIISNFKDNPKVLQPTEGLSEKNADGKPRIIVWPTANELTNSWKSHPSLKKVTYPALLKAAPPSTPCALASSSSLKTLAQSASLTALTVSQQSMIRSAPPSLSVLKQITMPVTRLPTSTPISQAQSSKTCVSVQPASLKPTSTQMLVQSSAPKALAQSVKAELPPQVALSNEPVLPSVTHVLEQSVVLTAQSSLATAQASSQSATQSSPTHTVVTQPILSTPLGAPLILTSAQPAPTVPQPPLLSQTPVTLSSPLFTQTIQQLITTPSDALESSPLPTNPTHALMETLLQSLMHAPIRTMSQPAVEPCTSVEIEVPTTEAGNKETTQEVMLLFADALSEK